MAIRISRLRLDMDALPIKNVGAPTVAADAARLTETNNAVETGLAVQAVRSVSGEEVTQVDTSQGPAVAFADATTQTVYWVSRWPFGDGAKVIIKYAASTAHAGSFRVQVGYNINGGARTNVAATITPGLNTDIQEADLGEIIAAAALSVNDMITFYLSRLGADAADTHTGVLRVFHTRIARS